MSDAFPQGAEGNLSTPIRSSRAFSRVAKYATFKALILAITVGIGLYLTILVVNLGGYVDRILYSDVADQVDGLVRSGALRGLPYERAEDIIWTTTWVAEETRGLHVPFMLRTWHWFIRSLSLDWGDGPIAFFASAGNYIPLVYGDTRQYLLEQFPYTMLLVGSATFLLFFTSVSLALGLSRRRWGKFMNWLIVVFSSATSIPAWIHGLILIFFLVSLTRLFPFPHSLGYISAKDMTPEILWGVVKSAILPTLALFASLFFQSVYTWRTFFLIYSEEDYVEMARAKGLPDGTIERRYILRPTLPYILTNFLMLVVSLWQGTIALELLFGWPGLGFVFAIATRLINVPLLLGIVTIFAYMLAITVFLLDFSYALIDPRVRVDFGAPKSRVAAGRRMWFQRKTTERLSVKEFQENKLSSRFTPESLPQGERTARKPIHSSKRSLAILRGILNRPAGVLGVLIILTLIGASIYAKIEYPGNRAVEMWSLNSEADGLWKANPLNAVPAWYNLLRRDKLPESISISSQDGGVMKETREDEPGLKEVTLSFPFEYSSGSLPQALTVFMDSRFLERLPLVAFSWITPDGRKMDLGSQVMNTNSQVYYLSNDASLQRKLGGRPVIEALFTDGSGGAVVKGNYLLEARGFLFEADLDLDVEMVLYGQVYGLAGTDDQRRDLMLPLLNGIPLALSFGILGAIATSLLAMLLAASGAWFGGWVDTLLQRISDINMILPTLAIAILVFLMYSNSIWVVLWALVLLSIFGSPLKNYRSVFLQIKEQPYIEAARAYGASDWRMIWRYLVPHILPVMVPQLVTMVPVYVYYEATLAFLGVRDPFLPTWGKVIYDSLASRAFQFYPHRIMIPLVVLLVTGLGFALLGSSLEQVLNPRLREK